MIKKSEKFLIEISQKNKWFLLIAALIFILILIFSLINEGFLAADFGVYYYACKSMLSGGEIYGTPFGHSMSGYYKYSPAVLFFYLPTNLLGFEMAAILNFLIQSLFALLSVIFSVKIINTYFNQNSNVRNIYLFLVFIVSLSFINRELLVGNVNLFLLFIICAALVLSLSSYYKSAGFLMGIAILFKPYLIVVTLPLMTRQGIKTLISTAIVIVIFSLLPFLYYGFEKGIETYMKWGLAMKEHDSYIISPLTMNSLINNYFFGEETFNFTYYIIAGIFIFYAVRAVYILIKQNNLKQSIDYKQSFLLESFTLLALVPNLVNTDIQQFVYAMPLIAFIVISLFEKKNFILTIIAILIFFFYTVDQPDILGRSYAIQIYENGYRGMSNIGIIIFVWVLFIYEKIIKPKKSLERNGFTTGTF